jgi:uncharacterized protein (DUF433 family)
MSGFLAGMLDTMILEHYPHITPEHIQKYVDEFSFRQNTRLVTNMFDFC